MTNHLTNHLSEQFDGADPLSTIGEQRGRGSAMDRAYSNELARRTAHLIPPRTTEQLAADSQAKADRAAALEARKRESTWTCDACGFEQTGKDRQCKNCGSNYARAPAFFASNEQVDQACLSFPGLRKMLDNWDAQRPTRTTSVVSDLATGVVPVDRVDGLPGDGFSNAKVGDGMANGTLTERDEGSSPATLLAMAVEKNLDIDKLEKLLQLKREWEANDARKQFFLALSKFQSEIPPIVKQDQAQRKKFASLGAINEAIRPWLFENELSFRFRQSQAPSGAITVTCVVSHAAGHSEETSLTADADNSGNKNPIQSIGSTITYLERYTLVGGLGLTTVDDDNDGNGQPQVVEPQQPKRTAEEIMRAAYAQHAEVVQVKVAPGEPTTVKTEPVTSTVVDEPSTPAQRDRIRQLFDALNATKEEIDGAFARRGVASCHFLTQKQAGELLVKLNAMLAERTAGESTVDPAATSAPSDGPCGAVVIAEIKSLIQAAQSQALVDQLTAFLKTHGLTRIADLSERDAAALKQALTIKNMEDFFQRSLDKVAGVWVNGIPF